MPDTVQVKEYRSPIWKYLMLFSLMVTIIFFGAYLLISEAFWSSIFQFIAFAGFAGTVLVLFRIKEKPKTIDVEINPKSLIVHYLRDKKEVKEEIFDRETIKSIEQKNVTPAWDFVSDVNVYEHIISFTDTDKKLSVFIYSGRNLHVNEEDASKFESFLSDINISFSH